MESKGIDIPGANPNLVDLLNTLASSLLKVIGTFENESLRINESPLLPLVDISIREEVDRIVQLPTLVSVYAPSFLDERVWTYFSVMREFYNSVDTTFNELNRLLSESPASSTLLSIPFTELQSEYLKMRKAKVVYRTVYDQMAKYRADKQL
ncbi:MAG: hypothetical protein ABR985_14425 [Methanotrichaceae archaeon]|jgi:hypothetical protein